MVEMEVVPPKIKNFHSDLYKSHAAIILKTAYCGKEVATVNKDFLLLVSCIRYTQQYKQLLRMWNGNRHGINKGFPLVSSLGTHSNLI